MLKPINPPKNINLLDMYEEWKLLWLSKHEELPSKKDMPDMTTLDGYADIVHPEWIELLSEYIKSDKPEYNYFAVFALCHYAVSAA